VRVLDEKTSLSACFSDFFILFTCKHFEQLSQKCTAYCWAMKLFRTKIAHILLTS